MSLFSRMLKANQWKDYSFCSEKSKITFCFYKHSFETPIYKIIYEKKSNNYRQWFVLHQNTKVRTSESLEKIKLLDEYEKFFFNTIEQSKIYIEFNKTLMELI